MCMVDDADSYGWQFLGRSMVAARKAHACSECNRPIAPGERYERAAGVSDGELMQFKACAHCIAARAWLDEHCGGWLFGGLFDDLAEHASAWDRTWAAGQARVLTSGMRRHWEGWTPTKVTRLIGARPAARERKGVA